MADTFEPGQRVTVYGRYEGPEGITTVEKVTHGGKRAVLHAGTAIKAAKASAPVGPNAPESGS
jgi:hypothetical protein